MSSYSRKNSAAELRTCTLPANSVQQFLLRELRKLQRRATRPPRLDNSSSHDEGRRDVKEGRILYQTSGWTTRVAAKRRTIVKSCEVVFLVLGTTKSFAGSKVSGGYEMISLQVSTVSSKERSNVLAVARALISYSLLTNGLHSRAQ